MIAFGYNCVSQVPSSRQLPHLEHITDMINSMRGHHGLAPLQHLSSRVRSSDAQAFADAHERIPGAPLVLFVDRSPGDARALRNSDEVFGALFEFLNVARVRFEGMELRRQMVVCEAADVFVSVRVPTHSDAADFVNHMMLLLQVHGCDASNIAFMRPGSVAVTVTL